jgi:hypothetical protein
MIIRTGLLWDARAQAGRPSKVLWLPLHNPFDFPDTLRIRAVPTSQPADSILMSVPGWASQAGHPTSDSGFPSLLVLPSAGDWVVVATTRRDWGCYLISVAP